MMGLHVDNTVGIQCARTSRPGLQELGILSS
jgi:hypothetical protein